MAGCCEYGNEPSGSIKGGKYLDIDLLASKELCSMELVELVPTFGLLISVLDSADRHSTSVIWVFEGSLKIKDMATVQNFEVMSYN
jgi:hypothetical protein